MDANSQNHNIHKIALLVAVACVLQASESMIPHPFPGIRLGLANILTLTALVTLGWKAALQIAVLRTLLSSIIMGTFMSPAFILSFSGAVISTLVMAFLYSALSLGNHRLLSIVGVSIIGALSHSATQLFLVYFLLIRNPGIFVLLPWLGIAAVITGWLNGTVARSICRKIESTKKEESESWMKPGHNCPADIPSHLCEDSFLHRLPAGIKVGSILVLSAVALFTNYLWLLPGMCCALIILAVSCRIPLSLVCGRLKRFMALILTAFALPLLFSSGTHEIFSVAWLSITREGLTSGALFSLRIVFLILLSSLMVVSTSPADLTRSLAKFLSPLRLFGISHQRIAATLILSWAAFPVVWHVARERIKAVNLKGPRDLWKMISLLSDTVAALYLQAERGSVFWQRVQPNGQSQIIAERESAHQELRTDSSAHQVREGLDRELLHQAAGGLGKG